jgi:hypothetical protein
VTEHPLAEAFSPVAETLDWLEVRVGDPGGGAVSVEGLAGDEELRRALDAVRAERTGPADLRTVGAAAVSELAEVLGAAAVPLATRRRVPLLDPARTAVRGWTEAHRAALVLDGTFACLVGDPAAAHPAARVVAGEEELWRMLSVEVERVGAPLVRAVHGATGFATRAQWALLGGGVGWAVGHAWTAMGNPVRGRREAARAGAAVEHLARLRPSFYLVEHEDRSCVGLVGAACCRAHLWQDGEHGLCTSCPLRPHEERVERMRVWLAERAPG